MKDINFRIYTEDFSVLKEKLNLEKEWNNVQVVRVGFTLKHHTKKIVTESTMRKMV